VAVATTGRSEGDIVVRAEGGWEGTRFSREGELLGVGTVAWCGDCVTVGGTRGGIGLVEGEGEVRWKEPHRQEWAGLGSSREHNCAFLL
jgi:hypothetical protein